MEDVECKIVEEVDDFLLSVENRQKAQLKLDKLKGKQLRNKYGICAAVATQRYVLKKFHKACHWFINRYSIVKSFFLV